MADTVLGLLFEISADPSKAQAAISKLASTIDRDLGLAAGTTKKFGEGAAAAGKDLLYLGGAAAGAVAGALALANKWAEAGAAIFEASEKTGLAAKNLSGLRVTTKLLDEDFGALVLTLGRMEKNITVGLRQPGEAAGKTLKGLFKSTDELNRLALLPMDDRVAAVVKRIFQLNDVGERNLALTNMSGRGYMQVLSSLQELAKGGYDPLIVRAKALGQFFDEQSAARAREFRIQLQQMKAEVSGLGLAIGKDLVPALRQLIGLAEIKLQQSLGKNLVQATRDAAAGMFRLFIAVQSLGTSEVLVGEQMDKMTLAIAGGKKETQAMTDLFVNLRAMTDALAKGTGDLGEAQSKAAKHTKVWSTNLSEMASIYRDLLGAQNPIIQAHEEYRRTLERIAMATGPGYNASLLEKMALEKRDAEITKDLTEAQKRADEAVRRATPGLRESALVLQLTKQKIQELPEALRGFAYTAEQAERIVSDAMRRIAQATTDANRAYLDSMAQMEQARQRDMISQVSMLLGTIGLRKAAAIVEATWETAQGIAALAHRDFWAAAQHFLAAAEYGVIAGTSGRSRGFQSAVGGAVSGATAAGGGAAGGGAPAAREERQATFQVIFQGPVYGGDAGINELVRKISEAVTERDVNLVSYTTVRQAATRA